MKNIAIALMLSLGLYANAQVKNVTKESTTTTVTVDNGTGKPKKVVKTENTEATQNIELKDADSKKLNKDIMVSPAQVTSSTTVTGDGIPTYYESNGTRYTFTTDRSGYRISTPQVKDHGVVRKMSNGQYIYRTKDGVSIGHFDTNGNFVLETYDDKTDTVATETYTKVQP